MLAPFRLQNTREFVVKFNRRIEIDFLRCPSYVVSREFTLAEIEHFVDPTDKSHPKFENVSSQKVTLYPSEYQIEGKPAVNIALEDAVSQVSLKYMKLWVSR